MRRWCRAHWWASRCTTSGSGARFHSVFSAWDGFNEAYRNHYNGLNLWRERGKEHFQTGQIVPTEQHTPLESLKRSEFYNDFMKRGRIEHGLVVVINRVDDYANVFSGNRSESYGHFDESEQRVTKELQPHLNRALGIQERLQVLEAGESLLNQLPLGIVFLTAAGRVVFANRAAEEMVRAKHALDIRGGILHAVDSRSDSELQHAIREAAAPGRSLDCPKAILLERPEGRAYQVVAAPVRRRFGQFIGLRAPEVVVLITDLDQTETAPAAILMRLYGLTAKEAEVAQSLVQGQTIEEAAGDLGMAYQTARTHLRHIFSKTGTGRQTELIRLLGGIPRLI